MRLTLTTRGLWCTKKAPVNSEWEICSAMGRSKDYILISTTCNVLTNDHRQFIVHFNFVSGVEKLLKLIFRIGAGYDRVIIRQTWSFQSYTTSDTQYSLRENLPVVFCQWCNCVWTLQKGDNTFNILKNKQKTEINTKWFFFSWTVLTLANCVCFMSP